MWWFLFKLVIVVFTFWCNFHFYFCWTYEQQFTLRILLSNDSIHQTIECFSYLFIFFFCVPFISSELLVFWLYQIIAYCWCLCVKFSSDFRTHLFAIIAYKKTISIFLYSFCTIPMVFHWSRTQFTFTVNWNVRVSF